MERQDLLTKRVTEDPTLEQLKIVFPQVSESILGDLLGTRGKVVFIAAPSLYIGNVYHEFALTPRDKFSELNIKSDAKLRLRFCGITKASRNSHPNVLYINEALAFTQKTYKDQLEKPSLGHLTAWIRDTADNRADCLPRAVRHVGAKLHRIPTGQYEPRVLLQNIEDAIDRDSLTEDTIRLRERLATDGKSLKRDICQYDGFGLDSEQCGYCHRKYGDDEFSIIDTTPIPLIFADYLTNRGFVFETDPRIARVKWIEDMERFSS